MEKEFIPYEEALALTELGFNEPCFTESNHKKKCEHHEQPGGCSLPNVHCDYPNCTIDKTVKSVPLPLYQQAFRWFREKYDLYYTIGDVYGDFTKWSFVIGQKNKGILRPFRERDIYFETYEEAELACLKQLIKIVNKTHKQNV